MFPGSWIIAAYTECKSETVSSEFNQAIAIYVWAWFVLNTLYVIAAVRLSWVLFVDLNALYFSALAL